MNILFLSIIAIRSINDPGIYSDLLREFIKNGHRVYVLSSVERLTAGEQYIVKECNSKIIKVKTGRIQKTNNIEKGINTVLLEYRFKKAVKKYLNKVKFDLVLYPTPSITFANVIEYVKKRDGAKSYLMLKDIFPQGAADIGALSTHGIKGIIYNYFREIEKKFYSVSDRIGCMSPANIEYVLKHNPELPPDKVELCPNSIEIRNFGLSQEEKNEMRQKYAFPIGKTIFVYGGNLGKPQGIPFFIECLRTQLENSSAFFLIVGSGTEYGALEDFFQREKPTNMLLMKSLPKEDYDRMIAACDVGMIFLDHRCKLPNFPSRLLSYMQADLPVLACTDPITDIGKVIVDGGFGWWCESDDANQFYNIVNRVLTHCSELPQMGKNGKEYLKKHFTVEETYKKIMKIYKAQTEGAK